MLSRIILASSLLVSATTFAYSIPSEAGIVELHKEGDRTWLIDDRGFRMGYVEYRQRQYQIYDASGNRLSEAASLQEAATVLQQERAQ